MLRREMFPAELCVLIRDEPFLSLSMLFFRDHGSQNEVHEFPMQVHQCLLWSGNWHGALFFNTISRGSSFSIGGIELLKKRQFLFRLYRAGSCHEIKDSSRNLCVFPFFSLVITMTTAWTAMNRKIKPISHSMLTPLLLLLIWLICAPATAAVYVAVAVDYYDAAVLSATARATFLRALT